MVGPRLGVALDRVWNSSWIDDELFQTLLAQVRELHRRTDELKRSKTRVHENVRARMNWSPAPSLPTEQRKLADEVVEALETPRLSSSQSRQLHRAYFK
jgi:hypothetical protein